MLLIVDFLMGGTAAAISKTAAAPIERVKILMQNQGSMLAAERLDRPYAGIIDCFKRTYQNEGMLSCKLPNSYIFFEHSNRLCSLARQWDERHSLLPYPSLELRLQRLLQADVQLQEI